MLLERLAEFPTVEKAAEGMAGNWTRWEYFVWFGRDEVPDSTNVALGYLVNHEATLRQMTNLEYVRQELKEFWGDLREGATVGDFGSSFWGDQGMLNGLMIRVVDDNGVTAAFRRLYEIARAYALSEDQIIDQTTFERVRKRKILGYVYRHLEHECQERGESFSMGLAERVANVLIAADVDYDNDDLDCEIDEEMGWAD